MLNFLILSEESFVMILLRFRLGSGVLKWRNNKLKPLSSLPVCLPVAGPAPGWQWRHRARGGWVAPVEQEALAGRRGGGRPRAQRSLGEIRGVGGAFTRARNEVLGLEVWREEEQSVGREREVPGWFSRGGGEAGPVREDGGGSRAAARAGGDQVGVHWQGPLLPGVRRGAGHELVLPGDVTARLHLQQGEHSVE